jgi:hypothetical protein
LLRAAIGSRVDHLLERVEFVAADDAAVQVSAELLSLGGVKRAKRVRSRFNAAIAGPEH